jgi:RimJ/RimL family protein N-acetyltransferase
MRHLGGVQSRSVAWRGLCAMAGAWSIRGFSMFAVTLRDTGEWIGRVGPWQPEDWPGTEIGWGLASRFAGRGFAREAASATIDYVVDVLGWTDIIHTIAPDNAESIALAQRLGSTNRSRTTLPPPLESLPVDDWGQSAADWRASRAGRG